MNFPHDILIRTKHDLLADEKSLHLAHKRYEDKYRGTEERFTVQIISDEQSDVFKKYGRHYK